MSGSYGTAIGAMTLEDATEIMRGPQQTPPLWTGRFSEFADLEFPTRNDPSRAKRSVRHHFAPIRLKSAFEALRLDGADLVDLQFALAGYVCATRTLTLSRTH